MTLMTAYRCTECSHVSEDLSSERWYECGTCGGERSTERQCDQCHKFMARAEVDQACEECGGECEEVELFQAPDGGWWDSEKEWREYNMPKNVKAREQKKRESDAHLEEMMQESRRKRLERGERALACRPLFERHFPDSYITRRIRDHADRGIKVEYVADSETVTVETDQMLDFMEIVLRQQEQIERLREDLARR